MNRLQAFEILQDIRSTDVSRQQKEEEQNEIGECLCDKRCILRILHNLDVDSFQQPDDINFDLTRDDLSLLFGHDPEIFDFNFIGMVTDIFTLDEIKNIILDCLNVDCCDRHKKNMRTTAQIAISNYGLESSGIDVSVYGPENMDF
jgi:hypothetical protein